MLLYDLDEYTHVIGSNVLSIHDGSEAELLVSHLAPDVLMPLMLNSSILSYISKGLGCRYLRKKEDITLNSMLHCALHLNIYV
jgi:hypothetical protein